MVLRIIRNKSTENAYKRIDFNFVRNQTITEQESYEYQQTFGKLVTDNKCDYSFLLSDLLNREDGSTHFLDKVLKYIECLKHIEREPGNLTIYNIDRSVLVSLKKYCKANNIKIGYNFTSLLHITILSYVKFLMRTLRAFFCGSFLRLYAKYKLNNKIDSSIGKVFISYFDYRSINGKKFTDPFFKPLQEYLRENDTPFAVVNILVYGYSIQKGIKQIDDIKKLNNSHIITLFNLIPLFGILSTFYKSYKLKPKLKQVVVFQNVNISDLLREVLKEEFFAAGLQYTLERSYLSQLLKYRSIETIYYPFENFAWEKFLCLEKNRVNEKVKLVGFQHTSFSLKLQHHFPSESEQQMPIFPSKILTTGNIPRSILSKYGSFPENIVQTGCALRHEYIFDILSNFKHSDKIHRKIAFAFSFDISRYNYIINKIISIFGEKNIEIILKYHPLNKDFHFNWSKMPVNIINGTNLSWEEIMGQIDLLLYEGNSVCIDALAHNIPPLYFPFTGDLYNTAQLYNYEWNIDAGDDESTYNERIEEILKMNLKNDKAFFDYNKNYVNNYFQPISKVALGKFLD